MPWYVEFTVTGLVDELACAQLYGIKRGAATGVEASRGVFERSRLDPSGRPWDGEPATGGVVFLDEIGDLSPFLQSKLLPVLSGGTYYLVGGEGDPDHVRSFEGIFLSATWRPLDARTMRHDLLSRLTANVIEVPSLSERREDLPEIIASVHGSLVERHKRRLDAITKDPECDKGFWKKEMEAIHPPTSDVVEQLATVDWEHFGDMRGLTGVLERIVLGRESADRVLAESIPIVPESDAAAGDGERLVKRILSRSGSRETLTRHVGAIEAEGRVALREKLNASAALRAQIAHHLSLEDSQLTDELRQLTRTRRTR